MVDSRFVGKSLTNQAGHPTNPNKNVASWMDFETDTRVLFNSLAAKRRSGKSGSRDSSDCYDSSKLWLQCDSSGIMAVWWKLLHILVGIPRYLATSKQSMVKGSELGSAEGHKNHKGL